MVSLVVAKLAHQFIPRQLPRIIAQDPYQLLCSLCSLLQSCWLCSWEYGDALDFEFRMLLKQAVVGSPFSSHCIFLGNMIRFCKLCPMCIVVKIGEYCVKITDAMAFFVVNSWHRELSSYVVGKGVFFVIYLYLPLSKSYVALWYSRSTGNIQLKSG